MEGGPQPHLPAARCPSTTTTRHELVTYVPSMARTFAGLPPVISMRAKPMSGWA